MSELTAAEVQAQQGTRLSETPPWMSYADELTEKLPAQLEAEVNEYAEHRYADDNTSSQNKEELHRQRELNEGLAKEYQWLHPGEYKDEGPRIGRVIHSDEFLGDLRRCIGNSCWYAQHPQPRKLTLLYDREDGQGPQVMCWVQAGYMPEFSFMNFDQYGVPLDEKRRGWRTPLLQLILKGIVSEETANKVFGRASGPASERYNRMLYEWRNRHEE